MCFLYRDDKGNETLQWCQGTIVRIHSNKSNDKKYIIAIIQWKDEFVAEGGANPTKEMLKMMDYNPGTHKIGHARRPPPPLNDYKRQLVNV